MLNIPSVSFVWSQSHICWSCSSEEPPSLSRCWHGVVMVGRQELNALLSLALRVQCCVTCTHPTARLFLLISDSHLAAAQQSRQISRSSGQSRGFLQIEQVLKSCIYGSLWELATHRKGCQGKSFPLSMQICLSIRTWVMRVVPRIKIETISLPC